MKKTEHNLSELQKSNKYGKPYEDYGTSRKGFGLMDVRQKQNEEIFGKKLSQKDIAPVYQKY